MSRSWGRALQELGLPGWGCSLPWPFFRESIFAHDGEKGGFPSKSNWSVNVHPDQIEKSEDQDTTLRGARGAWTPEVLITARTWRASPTPRGPLTSACPPAPKHEAHCRSRRAGKRVGTMQSLVNQQEVRVETPAQSTSGRCQVSPRYLD